MIGEVIIQQVYRSQGHASGNHDGDRVEAEVTSTSEHAACEARAERLVSAHRGASSPFCQLAWAGCE